MPLEGTWERWMRREDPPPLAKKLCSGCESEYALEADAGDEQGGTMWFGPCCETPAKYADVFIREASARRTRQPAWYRRAFCWYCRGVIGGPVWAQLAARYERPWPAVEAA